MFAFGKDLRQEVYAWYPRTVPMNTWSLFPPFQTERALEIFPKHQMRAGSFMNSVRICLCLKKVKG